MGDLQLGSGRRIRRKLGRPRNQQFVQIIGLALPSEVLDRQRTKRQTGIAAHRVAFELATKLVERDARPNVGHRRQPAPALLAQHGALHQGRQIVLPRRIVDHRFDQAEGIGIAADHQPPPVISALAGKDETPTKIRQAVADFALYRIELGGTIRQRSQPLGDQVPVDQRRGRQTRQIDFKA